MRTASVEAGHMTAPDQVADLPFFLAPRRSSTHGHRRRRAEPNAGPRTPRVCPHRITRNTGRAQCIHTADPCNKVTRIVDAFGDRKECARHVDWGEAAAGVEEAVLL